MSAPATAEKDTTASGDVTAKTVEQDDYSRPFAPIVKLDQVKTATGEEDEDVFFKIRAKLFRFSKELNEWKERGTGPVRVLQHKRTGKFRLLMRRDKTLKICLNHYVNKNMPLRENMGSDRSWVWSAVDYADGERDECMLAIRFANTENAQKFKKAYDTARDYAEKKSKGENPSRPEPMLEEEKESGSAQKKGAGEGEKPKSSMAAVLQEAEKSNAEKQGDAAQATGDPEKKEAVPATEKKDDITAKESEATEKKVAP